MSETKDSWLAGLVRWYGSHFDHPGQWRVVDLLRRVMNVRACGDRMVASRGFRWQLDPSGHMQAAVFWLGQMDRWEVLHLQKQLKGDWLMLDIGANFGYYSVRLAKGTSGTVYAFEPQSEVCGRLRMNVALNDLQSQVEVCELALSDREGTVCLTSHEGNTGKASISDEPGEVPMQRLDAFVKERGIGRIDAIKMDVEGAELKVLAGAEESLRKWRPALLIEVNPVALARHDASAVMLGERLQEIGYELHEINRGKLVKLHGFRDDREMVNALCLPPTS
ncbi:MAG: FkbM family methyltransferase [Verrucomicrobiaceae bacterium]|nr:FkbM family methyltransferase [Verrucomicrobiaceae bacterium]